MRDVSALRIAMAAGRPASQVIQAEAHERSAD